MELPDTTLGSTARESHGSVKNFLFSTFYIVGSFEILAI